MKIFISHKKLTYIFITLFYIFNNTLHAQSYNSIGQIGLINLPSAETKGEQSIYFTYKDNAYTKLGTITATPFDWLEASYFYYRPSDLIWGSAIGKYLDKGFNVKVNYKPQNKYLPEVAVGLDDFAGTGIFSKEYIVSTYDFNIFKLSVGIGWGKFVGKDNAIDNPLELLSDRFITRPDINVGNGGTAQTDLWFTGRAIVFSGLEIPIKKLNGLSLKIESNPFNYFEFGCCGTGTSYKTFELRNNESDINFGFSYKLKDFGNIDLSYIKGDTLTLSFSIGLSGKNQYRKKHIFKPVITDTNYQQDKKYEFYLDLLSNLNNNNLFLQTAQLDNNNLSITVDTPDIINPIKYTSRAAYISQQVAKLNLLNLNKIDIGLVTRGAEINNVSYRVRDLEDDAKARILVKKRTELINQNLKKFEKDEFKPKVPFPIVNYSFDPDVRAHVGSPEKFAYIGVGIRLNSEIQFNRNTTVYSSFVQNISDNFDEKTSCPCSAIPNARTLIVDYLQESDGLYMTNLQVDHIQGFGKDFFSRLSFGYFEEMYGGMSGEILYKPFNYDFAVSLELNQLKQRAFDGKFDFNKYKVTTGHLNVAYYEPRTNILAKWSYGRYLAKDNGYTLDLSRRMPNGWRAGIFYSKTSVSAVDFGEGSFDKGFYFEIPFNIFTKRETKEKFGFSLKTMTRDGGQKLSINNRLIDSFYGSTQSEINENWEEGYLK